jgi:diadenosine tetraphosphate (Ap4A) HIT family hydrolase
VKPIKKSLQTLKSDISNKESLLGIIRNHYPHLSELTQDELLAYFELTTFDQLKEHIENSLHTTSVTDNDTNDFCKCMDSNGEFKVLYETDRLAQKQADQLMIDKNIELRVYRCPYGYGWHLTSG